MSERESVGGGCLCGAVRFEIVLPSKWCAHCHCTLCRRAHGAGFVTWVGVEASQFRLASGERELRWFESSPPAKRGFCTRCGSTLFFRSTRWPTEMHVVLANLDGPIDRAPGGHVYYDSRVDWISVDDGLQRYDETSSG